MLQIHANTIENGRFELQNVVNTEMAGTISAISTISTISTMHPLPQVRLNRASSAVVLDFEPRTNSASSGSLVSEMGRQMNLVFSVQFMAPQPGIPGMRPSHQDEPR